ncbi:hypothetical protein GCM10011529_08340 [Polymorphobacter glacialis]|uniref:Beta-lactamase-related domain-containing protein n=1 Tax=Sandarakinorhabdus glacialis TaxID=1614636 RepID=A0A916ZM78_9SPHN|nr:serine hydrolase domain-containing protein [Polymorphobacter glacialis]GGE04313.1 hypothetical protein GCM10011529_08340 [Polymorphobacter glacialis]
MPIDRRLFLTAATALAVPTAARAAITATNATPVQQVALKAISAYLEAHRTWFALPAIGMVVTDGDFTAIIQSGTTYHEQHPLTGKELWQIGSISKSFVALVCLQLASEGKLDLEADIRTILPEAPLPPGAPFTIRDLLDHTTGLPDFAPVFAIDGSPLWRGFEPGTHWSYSNVGYNLVGQAIERIEGKPLRQSIIARIMKPLGMADSDGAIRWPDRSRYPARFGTLRPDLPVLRQNRLVPAAWVDANLAAGSVAATLPDMARYLRFLIGVGTGAGKPLISDAMAKLWLARPARQDPEAPTETYGLGLMHRVDDGRALLHHTGGMVSFSSSFHVDPAAGTGAFASCAIGGTGYRPRLLTRFAVQALRLAREGKPIPVPPALGPKPLEKPADFAGRYAGPAGTLTIGGSPALGVTSAGTTAALESQGTDQFATSHPAFADFALLFVRSNAQVVAIDHGLHRFVRDGASAPLAATPAHIAARAGCYRSDDPWLGGLTLVARGDRLIFGGTDPLIDIGNDVWRLEAPDWNPERLGFGGFVGGRPQIAIFSGRTYERRDA